MELNELVASDPAAKSLMHDVYRWLAIRWFTLFSWVADRYLAAPTQRRLGMEIPGSRPRNSILVQQ